MHPTGRHDPSWSEVAWLLAPARSFWLGTTNPDGSPHAAPVWGVVVEDHFYIYSERRTQKARNLLRDWRAVVHLESADNVVIVHGRFEDTGRPGECAPVVQAFGSKYTEPGDGQYLPSTDESFDLLYRLCPRRALLWSLPDYDGTQRRWAGSPESA